MVKLNVLICNTENLEIVQILNGLSFLSLSDLDAFKEHIQMAYENTGKYPIHTVLTEDEYLDMKIVYRELC